MNLTNFNGMAHIFSRWIDRISGVGGGGGRSALPCRPPPCRPHSRLFLPQADPPAKADHSLQRQTHLPPKANPILPKADPPPANGQTPVKTLPSPILRMWSVKTEKRNLSGHRHLTDQYKQPYCDTCRSMCVTAEWNSHTNRRLYSADVMR